MTPFAIAGIQMHVSASHPNLAEMGRRLDGLMARFPWIQLVLFSELAAYGPDPAHAQPIPGPASQTFAAMAAHHGIWLVPGSIFERADDHLYNTALVFDPGGHLVGRYRKMFPFRPYESGIEAGHEFLTFEVPEAGRFGLSICYDMWFPETTRTLAALGAEVILHPTMTDTIDRDVELAIARASAATNQCYFFDINGIDDGGCGRSIIVGPSGYVIHQAGAGREAIPVEINLDRVRRERAVGSHGLGQPLKSFRDRAVDFGVYRPESFATDYLNSLRPLTKPQRGSRAGLEEQDTEAPLPAVHPIQSET